MALLFHPLPIARVRAEADGAAAITLAVPPPLQPAFDFKPGQFLTVRARIDGEDIRRSYSICSAHGHYRQHGELSIGIKPVAGGLFSRWAVSHLQPGATLDAMAPDGRFTPRAPGARHRVGFAAGSGITPLLSIIASTLADEPDSSFTLVYGNRAAGSVLFHDALAGLKDRYPARLSVIHVLSRQAHELPLLHGRLDEAKVRELLGTLVVAGRIDEAFVCGPGGMIDSTERALLAAGVDAARIHSERFVAAGLPVANKEIAVQADPVRAAGQNDLKIPLDVVLDGKTHRLAIAAGERVLDVALAAGLDLPYSCRAGVCCTCRARVLDGQVAMARNYTLEPWEMARGFVLTCQARPVSEHVTISFDER